MNTTLLVAERRLSMRFSSSLLAGSSFNISLLELVPLLFFVFLSISYNVFVTNWLPKPPVSSAFMFSQFFLQLLLLVLLLLLLLLLCVLCVVVIACVEILMEICIQIASGA